MLFLRVKFLIHIDKISMLIFRFVHHVRVLIYFYSILAQIHQVLRIFDILITQLNSDMHVTLVIINLWYIVYTRLNDR